MVRQTQQLIRLWNCCPMRRHIIFIIAVMFIVWGKTGLAAEQVTVVTLSRPPLGSMEKGKPVGIFPDILNEVGTLTGITFEWEFQPWARAQKTVSTAKNYAIVNLKRTPERETRYTWIASMTEDNMAFVILKTTIPPKTIDAAKSMTVGGIIGSKSVQVLIEKGFPHIETVARFEQNVKKLFSGRIEAFVVNEIMVNTIIRDAGMNPDEVTIGLRVAQLGHSWLAASPGFPETTAKKIARAIKTLKDNGKFDQIVAEWLSR